MTPEESKIKLYNKREGTTETVYVYELGKNKFRMADNAILNCKITLGTEFETRINSDGSHEIIRITKASDFVTRRFLLSAYYKQEEYEFLGDELTKRGGFWQVDFGSIATVNIPKDFEFDVDKTIKDLGLDQMEIIE